MKWDKFFDQKIKEIAKGKLVLDVGTNQRLVEDLKKYESFFKDVDYKTFDQAPGADIVGDLCQMDIESDSVDGIICRAVLEHVKYPKKAIEEIHRVLKPGGKCLGYVPFLYPIHAEKGKYGDYWRFTKQGLELILRDFSQIEICPVYGFCETWLRLLPVKLLRRILAPVGRFLDLIFRRYNQTSGYYFFVIK